jgi:hypothetical protein
VLAAWTGLQIFSGWRIRDGRVTLGLVTVVILLGFIAGILLALAWEYL